MKNTENRELKEALIRQGVNYLLDNDIVDAEPVINDLIIAGFMSNDKVVDVAMVVDEEGFPYAVAEYPFNEWIALEVSELSET